MDEQPEALRWAHLLETTGAFEAAAELRRLHEVNQELLEALQGMVDIASDSRGVAGYHLNGEIAEWDEFPEWQAACAAIAKATGGAV